MSLGGKIVSGVRARNRARGRYTFYTTLGPNPSNKHLWDKVNFIQQFDKIRKTRGILCILFHGHQFLLYYSHSV